MTPASKVRFAAQANNVSPIKGILKILEVVIPM